MAESNAQQSDAARVLYRGCVRREGITHRFISAPRELRLEVNGAIGVPIVGVVAVLARLVWPLQLGRAARKIEIRYQQELSSTDAVKQLTAAIET